MSADERVDTIESVRGWLGYEPELAGLVAPVPVAAGTGALSWTTQALIVAVGSGGTMSVLAASLGAWLNQPRNADVRIELNDGAGRSVVIDAKRVKDLDRLISDVFAREKDDRHAGDEHGISAS